MKTKQLLRFVSTELEDLRVLIQHKRLEKALKKLDDIHASLDKKKQQRKPRCTDKIERDGITGRITKRGKCEYEPVKGLEYKRRGQTITRLRCRICGHTKSSDKLSSASFPPYKQVLFLVLSLEGMKVSEFLELFPGEQGDLYYWWRKCQKMTIKDLAILRHSTVDFETPRRGKELFKSGGTYFFHFIDEPQASRLKRIGNNLDLTFSFEYSPNKHHNLTSIRLVQLLLLGATKAEVKEYFSLPEWRYYSLLERTLSNFTPLPHNIAKRPNKERLRRDWSMQFNFSLHVTTEKNPHLSAPYRIKGKSNGSKLSPNFSP